jgi:deoxyribonuclease I
MEHLFNLLIYFFTFISSVSGLLLGISFTKGQRDQYPFLKWLDGKQLVLAVVIISSLAISQGSGYLKEHTKIEAGVQELKNLGAYESAISHLLQELNKGKASPKNVNTVLGGVIKEYRAIQSQLEILQKSNAKDLNKAVDALNALKFDAAAEFIVASTFSKAKKNLNQLVFNDNEIRKTFYCGCTFSQQGEIDSNSCSIDISERRNARVEWDHIVPISWIGIGRKCWSSNMCESESGKKFGGRRCCTKIDPYFNQAQNDLHNIWPSAGGINMVKSNFEANDVGEFGLDVGCGFLIEKKGFRFEPPNEVKGDVARVVLYMADTYEVPLGFHQKNLLLNWAQKDPVSDWERKRNLLVYDLQGNSNSHIEKLPNKKIQLTAKGGS